MELSYPLLTVPVLYLNSFDPVYEVKELSPQKKEGDGNETNSSKGKGGARNRTSIKEEDVNRSELSRSQLRRTDVSFGHLMSYFSRQHLPLGLEVKRLRDDVHRYKQQRKSVGGTRQQRAQHLEREHMKRKSSLSFEKLKMVVKRHQTHIQNGLLNIRNTKTVEVIKRVHDAQSEFPVNRETCRYLGQLYHAYLPKYYW